MASLDGAFVFSLIWAVAGACDGASRSKFDAFLRALLVRRVDARVDRDVDRSKGGFDLGPGIEIKYPPVDGPGSVAIAVPQGCSVFDLVFDPVNATWRAWLAPGTGAGGEGGEEGSGVDGGGGAEGEDEGALAVEALAPVPHESTPFNEIVVTTVDRCAVVIAMLRLDKEILLE